MYKAHRYSSLYISFFLKKEEEERKSKELIEKEK
jgi:hypothetical protein